MIYRIYNETNKGFKLECVVKDIDELFIVLDTLIIDENNNHIIVIEHNIEENYDNPMYVFTGDVMKYVEYRDNYYYKRNKKTYRIK